MARYTRNEASTVPQINTELEKIEAAIEDSLSRKGDAPNSMSGPLDMNNQRILNIPEPVDATDPLRKIDGEQYVTAAAASAAQALESEENAEASAISAAASASSASADADVAAGLIEDLNSIYLGAFTTGPSTDNEGEPLKEGALYYNTVTKNLMVFNGTSWVISVSQALADAAAASAAQAEDSAAAALASEQAADASEQLAEQHKDTALASASSATSSASAASASQTAAAGSASDAATSASQSSSSATASAASASSAATSETNASNSASAAALSESNASTSEANAAASESAAALSEASASSSAAASAQSASDASASETAAQQSAVAALASENAAATSATSAAGSATAASASATAAGDSASAALASEQAAATSESNAATSASQAAGSASSASASASAAATSESNAATSETNAAGSATSAASSASAAAGSATSASNSAATALLYLNDTEAARDEVLQYSTAVSKGLVFVGVYDASTGVYPTLPVDVIGNPFWIIQTGGTISGTVYQAGDSLIRDVENSQWIKLDTVDQVSSVAGKVGAVVLDKVDVGLSNVDNTSDLNKPISTATQSALDNKSNVGHTHVIADVSNLQSSLDGKAAVSHTHIIGDVTGLQTALDGKAAVSHTHSIANVTGLQSALDGKAPLTGAGTSGTWPISVTGSAGSASTASSATFSSLLSREDNRTISPSELPAGNLKFGFTSWNNNSGSPYADFIHMRGYTDSSGGSDNLLMFSKSGLGMRLWQQSYGSGTAYSSYKDVAWTDGTNASGTWGISITGNAATVTNGVYTTGDQDISGTKQFLRNSGGYSGLINTAALQAYATGGNSAFMSFHRAGNYAVNLGLDADNILRIGGWSAPADRWALDMSGNNTVPGSSRAPIFYDSNNTGYYVDPASTSNMNSVSIATLNGHALNSDNYLGRYGNSYYQGRTWLQFTGAHGLYCPTVNDFHFFANNSSSYASATLRGNRGGYYGIYFENAGGTGNNAVHIMYDGSGNGGIFQNAGWHTYFHRGNSCLGVNTSTTSSSYGLYVNKAIYSTGNITAYSDARVKENVETIPNALGIVKNLRGVYYNKIDDPNKTKEIGFIAQEVAAVEGAEPLVTYAQDVDQYGVAYGNTTALLVEAIKELSTQVESLKLELGKLKNEKNNTH